MKRPKSHTYPSALRRGANTHLRNWIGSLRAQGLVPEVIVLEQFSSNEDLAAGECFWIAQGRGLGWALINLTRGGDGLSGFSHSAVTRAKLSRALMGHSVSDETRRKMRENKKTVARPWAGKQRPPETRAKVAATLRARWQDPEFRRDQLARRRRR